MQISGAHVLITGGSRGIGAAMAREFAKAGAEVSVAARSEGDLKQVAADIGGHAFVVDLTDPVEVDGLVAQVESDVRPIDILVNNAGIETTNQHAALDVNTIRTLCRVNFEAPVVLTRHVLRGMHARGTGHLVFTSSLAGSAGFPGLAAYAGSKAGLNNFVASLRIELSGTEIGTTIVAPGPIDTRMWDALEESNYADDLLKRFNRLQLIPKMSPEKLAKRTVAAVESNRRHVRHPRRLSMNFMLPEVPRRMTEGLVKGIEFQTPPPPD